MDLDDPYDMDDPGAPAPPAERIFYLLDKDGKPLPDEEPHAELGDANRRAQELGRRVIVVKRLPSGEEVHMSYTGPGGWLGPKSRPRIHPDYTISPRRTHPERH